MLANSTKVLKPDTNDWLKNTYVFTDDGLREK